MAKKTAKPALKPAPKPTPRPLPRPRPAPLDLVRSPNFDSAMAQQNFLNSLADLRAKADAERGTPTPSVGKRDPRDPNTQYGGPVREPKAPTQPRPGSLATDPADPRYGFDKSKRRAGKEILLSFAGGQYGSINDEAADAIAKKYNLDIVNKPNPNKDGGPKVYRFSVKGDVDKGLSGIKNEPGVRYAEPNFRGFIPEQGPDPFITYEDQRMKAALDGEELPTPPAGYVEGFDRSKKNPTPPMIGGTDKLPPQGPQVGGSSRFDDYRGQPQLGQQSTNSTAGYVQQDPMAGMQNNPSIYDSLRPDYSQVGTVPMRSPENPNQNNFGQIAQGIGRLMPQNPQGQQQQMQSYQNFLNQGMNNMASVNQGAAESFANTQPGMQAPQAGIGQTNRPNMPSMGMQQRRPNPPRKFSTVSNSPARFA